MKPMENRRIFWIKLVHREQEEDELGLKRSEVLHPFVPRFVTLQSP